MIILNQLQKRFSPSFARIARKGSERPTKYIYLLILILIALFMQAYIHNYNIVYLALFFTFAFAFSSYFFGRNNIRSLEVALLSSQRVFANQKSSYTLLLSSSSERELYDITCICSEERQHCKRISADSPEVLTFSHTCAKRGERAFESVQCDSGFPLPHQLFYKVFDLQKSFVVYPEPKGESLDAYIARNRAIYGEKDDFEGVKGYERSDRISQIYWPSIAKGGSLMSKVFTYINDAQLLHFDFLSCGTDDEQRLSQLSLWVLECEQRGYAFTIAIGKRLLESKKMSTDEILTYLGRY
ncbi:DUF58 domain-containing protein [Sulfurimonas sp. HSL3-7]|uniref:DUF58 domain-containing protein n=1 Tax=Sulfonitrofixus jiaomeiensis TaxID=3131938 RepID=UPI0031F8CD39